MVADIIRHPGASNVAAATDGDIEDRFRMTFEPAQPVLDAMAQLRKVRHFIAKRDRVDPNRNGLFGDLLEQVALIPDMAILPCALPSRARWPRSVRPLPVRAYAT